MKEFKERADNLAATFHSLRSLQATLAPVALCNFAVAASLAKLSNLYGHFTPLLL
jgi:hypothetical protein